MTKTYTIKSALLTTAMLIGLPSAALAQDVIGVNAAVKGQVTIQSQGEDVKKAIVKDDVRLGDQVNSARVSSLQVLLKDQTVFTVGPECELVIDRFVYDPDKDSNSLQANVTKGMFRFMSGNISKSGPESVSIDTPVASLGVRGTIVEGLVGEDAIAIALELGLINDPSQADPDGATIFVLRGPGSRQTGSNPDGEIRIVSRGGAITVNQSGNAVFIPRADSAPIGPFVLPPDSFKLFNERLRTEPTTGPDFRTFDVDVFVLPEEDDDLPGVPQKLVDPIDTVFDPFFDLEWPDEDIFDSPCGVANC
ncbi:FecR domain-containing protein [Fretibacter rubidus]|uniref:FecR family protein n=1 Tax=Fretibacter rubidus TaxID=570162 RepID=UPI00352B14F6